MVCETCGDETKDNNCDCWTHCQLFVHPIGDIYDLGRYCQACQEGANQYCTCYLVREMVKKFELKIKLRNVNKCLQKIIMDMNE